MAVGYSYDLRKKAVELVEAGNRISAIARMLNIGRSALQRWVGYARKDIDLAPKKNWQKGYGHKITDLEKFRKFVDENSDLTLEQLANKWGAVKRTSVQRAMKKIGYSKKKDIWVF